MGLNARNPDFVACEQQTADQPEHSRSLISAFVIHYHNNGADQPAPWSALLVIRCLKSKTTRSEYLLIFYFIFWWASTWYSLWLRVWKSFNMLLNG